MAGKSTYTIILKNGTGGGNSPLAGSGGAGTSSGNQQVSAGRQRAQDAVKVIVAYDKFVEPFVNQIVSHQVGTIQLRTGAAELQQRVEFGMNVAKSAAGLGASILTGYAVGNVPGAIIGGLISVGTQLLGLSNRSKEIQMNKDLEDISIMGMDIRAGGNVASFSQSRGTRQ